jgi:hypothetical protein
MPIVWGGQDFGSQIWSLGFLLLAATLLWLELVEEKKATVFSNKVALWFGGGCDLDGLSSITSSSLSCRGSEGRGGDGIVIFFRWCGNFELNHADGIIASTIVGRQGGHDSTSDVEAFHRVCCWSSTRILRQVVRTCQSARNRNHAIRRRHHDHNKKMQCKFLREISNL